MKNLYENEGGKNRVNTLSFFFRGLHIIVHNLKVILHKYI